jgi:hypothetical protein
MDRSSGLATRTVSNLALEMARVRFLLKRKSIKRGRKQRWPWSKRKK